MKMISNAVIQKLLGINPMTTEKNPEIYAAKDQPVEDATNIILKIIQIIPNIPKDHHQVI
jgi:hypothetical protein